MRSGRLVCRSVIVCVCLLAGLLQKDEPFSLKLVVMIMDLPIGKNWLTFGGDPVPDTDSRRSISLAIAE